MDTKSKSRRAKSRRAKSRPAESRWGSWLILGVLVALLGVAMALLHVGWDPEQDASLALGIGLMTLMVYSSRSGTETR